MESRKTYTAPQMEITVFEYADSMARADIVGPSGVDRLTDREN